MGRREGLVVGLAVLHALWAASAAAAAPEVGWELSPGDGVGGAPESQTASAGPIQGQAANGPPGVTSVSAAEADFGSLAASTATTVDAAAQTGESFCLVPHCSEVEARWADRLTFVAPGVVPNGTAGSFTAEINLSGALAATLSPSWSFVSVASLYDLFVEVDFVTRERIMSSCSAIPFQGMPCIPVTQQLYTPDSGPVQTIHSQPFGTFQLGPYDFTWGQPFDLEVRLAVHAILDAASQTAGTSSAVADLADSLVWEGVVALYDGPGGTGAAVPLDEARVSPASGRDWLQTVAVPEPRAATLSGAAAAALLLSAAAARRRR